MYRRFGVNSTTRRGITVRMRIAVIADTHMPRGSRRLPEACGERVRAADVVLHSGDVTGLSFWAELSALGRPLYGVRGNMDEPALAAVLPETQVVELGSIRVGILHVPGPAAGREMRLVGRFPDCAAVVYGHTHLPQVERWAGTWILNPGSPTERRRAASRTMLELWIDRHEVVPELIDLGD
jgi:putative phosphoesterase